MKIYTKKSIEASNGITLIALVITIIVLLILAGISISMLSGDNGILQKATTAKTETEKSQEQEVVTLAYNSALAKKVSNGDSTAVTDGDLNIELTNQGAKAKGNNPITVTFDVSKRQYTIDNGIVNFAGIKSDSDVEEDTPQEITASTPAGTVVITPNNWTTLQGKAISDGNGTAIPLPTGFFYVGGNYNTGLVISDKENDTIDALGTSMGNQFVWIPVPNEESFIRTDFDDNGNPTNSIWSETSAEPYGDGYQGEESEFNNMKTQVLKYRGFYLGRYEAGVNSTIMRDNPTTDQSVVCKKGVAPYNFIPWGASITDINSLASCNVCDSSRNVIGTVQTHGAVYLSKKMYENSNSVTSTLCYGSQWDAMCRYIGDSQRMPSSTEIGLTGSVRTDISKNIYDLAGNCFEWSMELIKTGYRSIRGGFNLPGPTIRDRYAGYGIEGYNDYFCNAFCFRVALYVK